MYTDELSVLVMIACITESSFAGKCPANMYTENANILII